MPSYHLVTHRFQNKDGVLQTFGYEIMKNNKRFLRRKQLENMSRAKCRELVRLLNA